MAAQRRSCCGWQSDDQIQGAVRHRLEADFVGPRSFAGQTVQLEFTNWNRHDNKFNTWSFVDDIRLMEWPLYRTYLSVASEVRTAAGQPDSPAQGRRKQSQPPSWAMRSPIQMTKGDRLPSAGPGKIIPGPKPAAGAEETRPGTGQPSEAAPTGPVSPRVQPRGTTSSARVASPRRRQTSPMPPRRCITRAWRPINTATGNWHWIASPA